MREITAETVGAYLVERGVFDDPSGLEVVELAGGISAAVFAVRANRRRVVVKQALPRFRVADEWLVPTERAIFEARALELMAGLAPGSVPPVVDVDPELFTLVMEAAPASWAPWKSQLLEGRADREVARRLGELLAILHTSTHDVDMGSAESFETQRLDPYLRTVQRRHPGLAGAVGTYIAQLEATSVCVVHGDYSPKNVLVGEDGLWIVDWEIVHRGDPAFDLAFLLNHLMLKAIHRPGGRAGYESCGRAFLATYGPGRVDLTYVLGLVGCLMLARVDGKSPAEYLDERGRRIARSAGIALLTDPPGSLAEAWETAVPHPRP